MYIPKHFEEKDKAEIVSFMKQYSFATVVTAKDGDPVANHLPFVIEEERDDIILVSHFSRANTQWHDIIHNNRILVIFTEPHAYISPTHYDSTLNVPTWNYIAVHAYGSAELIEEPAEIINALEAMIGSFEPAYQEQWETLPDEYKQKMIRGIVPFRINVSELQAKKKLSQNKKEGERKKIIDALSESKFEAERQIADFMKRNEDAS